MLAVCVCVCPKWSLSVRVLFLRLQLFVVGFFFLVFFRGGGGGGGGLVLFCSVPGKGGRQNLPFLFSFFFRFW